VQTVQISVYRLQSAQVAEFYITAVPSAGGATEQAQEVYQAVAAAVDCTGGRIFQERVFFAPGNIDIVQAARAKAYGELDDGVPPTLLHVVGNADGAVTGVQAHVVACDSPIEPFEVDGKRCGRVVRAGGRTLLGLAGMTAVDGDSACDQARLMLMKAEKAANMAGGDMFSVVRTWMWLGDLLSWYDDFNDVRNAFFRQVGLISPGGVHRLPASTGISIAPATGGYCGMDMVAVIEKGGPTAQSLLAGGDQGSAYDYGSAFSRGLRAHTLAGETVYISGTAAIDASGRTEHIGDIGGQVASTIAHSRTVLGDLGCGDEDVVQAMAYCKTAEVEQFFRREYADLCWPSIISVCDVCRHDLLFEVEVTASSGAEKF